MSENTLPVSEEIDLSQPSIPQISGGALLKKAREAEGLHIAALAVLLKVSVKKLEALEADRFDLLPDTVFVRALAASICRTLKVDPTSILEKLPHTTAQQLKTDESGINTPFRTSGGEFGLPFWHQLSKPFVLAVLALLIGVVVIVFFPITQKTEVVKVSNADSDAVVSSSLASTPSPITTENFPAAETAATVRSSSLPSPSLETPLAIIPAPVASSASLPEVVLNTPSSVVAGSGVATGLVVFKAHGVSWVEVVDAGKVVQLRKTMTNGEVVGASGAMPLAVVVGRADTTEVQVRGKPFDLVSIAKDNVARFEVK
ncbi:MAG: RodZ domain-containing protein [Pseudomonadota bacterium]